MANGYIFRREGRAKKKLRFKVFDEADKKADAYNQRVLFADMQAYWCRRHSCWHIGHFQKSLSNARRFYASKFGKTA